MVRRSGIGGHPKAGTAGPRVQSACAGILRHGKVRVDGGVGIGIAMIVFTEVMTRSNLLIVIGRDWLRCCRVCSRCGRQIAPGQGCEERVGRIIENVPGSSRVAPEAKVMENCQTTPGPGVCCSKQSLELRRLPQCGALPSMCWFICLLHIHFLPCRQCPLGMSCRRCSRGPLSQLSSWRSSHSDRQLSPCESPH